MSTQNETTAAEDLAPTQDSLFDELEEDELEDELEEELEEDAEEEAGKDAETAGGETAKKAKPPRSCWDGSEVTEAQITWLRNSRRIPEGVACRLPGSEVHPTPEEGEYVVFLAHFER